MASDVACTDADAFVADNRGARIFVMAAHAHRNNGDRHQNEFAFRIDTRPRLKIAAHLGASSGAERGNGLFGHLCRLLVSGSNGRHGRVRGRTPFVAAAGHEQIRAFNLDGGGYSAHHPVGNPVGSPRAEAEKSSYLGRAAEFQNEVFVCHGLQITHHV